MSKAVAMNLPNLGISTDIDRVLPKYRNAMIYSKISEKTW